MILSIALNQIQRKSWWEPEPTSSKYLGRKTTDIRTRRAENLYRICTEIGGGMLDDILDVNAVTDSRLHRDDARRIMNEMVANGQLVKIKKVIDARHRVFYAPVQS